MKDYEKTFLDLCSRMICEKVELVDKLKMKRSNEAGKKMFRLFLELQKEPDVAMETLPNLMENENEQVQLQAAAICLRLNIQSEKAIRILKNISIYGKYDMLRIDTKMIMEYGSYGNGSDAKIAESTP